MRTIEEIHRMSPAEEDEDLLYLIGTIAVRWATLDPILIRVLGHLLKGNNQAADIIYFSLANFRARLDIIQNLATETVEDGAYKETLLNLLDRIGNLATARNKLIHVSIVSKESDPLALESWRREPGRKKPFQLIPVRKNDLIDHAKTLVEIAVQLQMLIKPEILDELHKILEQHEASPETPK